MVTESELRQTRRKIHKIYQEYLSSQPSYISRFKKEDVIDMITNHLLAEAFRKLEKQTAQNERSDDLRARVMQTYR